MAAQLPSSRFHCLEVCPFRDVEPAETEGQNQLEQTGVITQLRELEGETQAAGILPSSRKQLGAKRVHAIRGCAAAIFNHDCGYFFNEYDMTTMSYQLIYMPSEPNGNTPSIG